MDEESEKPPQPKVTDRREFIRNSLVLGLSIPNFFKKRRHEHIT